jgi:hypothetical protein
MTFSRFLLEGVSLRRPLGACHAAEGWPAVTASSALRGSECSRHGSQNGPRSHEKAPRTAVGPLGWEKKRPRATLEREARPRDEGVESITRTDFPTPYRRAVVQIDEAAAIKTAASVLRLV